MSRRLIDEITARPRAITVAIAFAAGIPAPAARAQAPTSPAAAEVSAATGKAPADMGDQAIGAELGFASGGRVTPGGFRIAGHYLYQLSEADWFDGVAGFTFGGDSPQCFRDRNNEFLCNHGVAEGDSIDIAASVRHFFSNAHRGFWPFLRGGVGLAIVRFRSDDVTGLALPLLGAAGLRVSVTTGLALVGEAQVQLGFGSFNHSLGLEPQLGAAITIGAEFRL